LSDVTPEKLEPSEFEGNGPHPFGGFGKTRARDALGLMKRTGQDPEGVPNLDAPVEDFEGGGITKDNWPPTV
jgi:hypothetical protein